MKLIVQIPAFNEELTIAQTINDIPKYINGINQVEILIVDDGSTDNTVDIAKQNGAHHVIRNVCNKGLAKTFAVGLDACLRLGADIIVNTDGDNQYKGNDIPKLVAPILSGDAEIVVGDRQTDQISHFSTSKKFFQRFGSFVVRSLSKTKIPDAVSGFRAYSRSAAMQVNIVSSYSYTIETIIHAGKSKMAINSVPIGTNFTSRKSRLVKSIPSFIINQLSTMVRIYTMYQPLKVFFYIGVFLLFCGLIPSIRFIYYIYIGQSTGHIQSLILSTILFIIGFQALMIAIVADVISFNRKLIEETLFRVKNLEFTSSNKTNDDAIHN